jgi:glycosyltransferase involved in cell wall biosynthesis
MVRLLVLRFVARSAELASAKRTDRRGATVKLVVAGASLQPNWGGGEPIIVQELITGLGSRGFEVAPLTTRRTLGQMLSMSLSPRDWDVYTYLQYLAKLEELDPDCVLAFYDYDSSLLRACTSLEIPYVAAVHIYWPVCPVGTLYVDRQGVCPGPEWSRCLRHMSGAVPPTRLPLGATWVPAPLGASIYLKTRQRAGELAQSRAIVVPGQRMLEILRGFGLRNISQVPNGLDLRNTPARSWTHGRKRILFASGATSERKGFGHFVKVATALSPAGGDTDFAATSYSGNGVVKGLGRLPYVEVLREMRESYAVVAPSLWEEPYSVTIQEAMASGKPVVAYDIGGNAELLGGTGVIVPPGDVAALESAVRDLLFDERRAVRLGSLARARADAMFDSGRMVDGYARVLNAVA